MANVSAVNIGISMSIKDLVEKTNLARNQVQKFVNDVKKSMTDAQRFAQDVKVADAILAAGEINQAEYNQVIAMYKEKYKIIDEGEQRAKEADQRRHEWSMMIAKMRIDAVKQEQAEYEAARQARLTSEEQDMLFRMNLKKTLQDNEKEIEAKKKADIEANRKAEEESLIFLMNLAGTARKMKEEDQQKKMEQLAAERKAEEESLIFLMKLAETARKMREEDHQKKMEQLAAERKFAETLGVLPSSNSTFKGRATYTGPVDLGQNNYERIKEALNLEDALLKLEKDEQQFLRVSAEENATREKQRHAQVMQDIRAETEARRKSHADYMDRMTAFLKNKRSAELAGSGQSFSASSVLMGAGSSALSVGSKLGGSAASALGIASISQLTGAMVAATGITNGLMMAINALKHTLSITVEYERTEAALGALTGSAENAKKMMMDFRRLDKETPLSFVDFARGAQTLIGFGVDADRVTRIMESLSAASMGNQQRFQSLALAFGQVAASGRLAGQEVLQFVNAGLNPLREVSNLTGLSMAKLKKMTEEGKIGFETIAIATEHLTQKGGRLAEMNEKLQGTLGGQFDKLQSDLNLMAVTAGSELVPIFMNLVKLMQEFAGNPSLDNTLNGIREWAGFMNLAIISIYGTFAMGQGELTKRLEEEMKRQVDEHNKRENAKMEAEKKRIEEGKKALEERANAEKEFGRAMTDEEYSKYRIEKAQKEHLANQEALKKEADMNNEISRIHEEFLAIGRSENDLMKEKLGLIGMQLDAEAEARSMQAYREHEAVAAEKERKKLQQEYEKEQEKIAKNIEEITKANDPYLDQLYKVADLQKLVENGLDPKHATSEALKGIRRLLGKDDAVTVSAVRAGSAEAKLMALKLQKQVDLDVEANKILDEMLKNLEMLNNAGIAVGLAP